MTEPKEWQPDRSSTPALPTLPPLPKAMLRGARNLCPVCGQSKLFQGWLRLEPRCAVCGTPLGAVRADDAPPYFTILLVGHLLAPILLIFQENFSLPVWLQAAILLPLALILALGLLRPVKGATVALMLRLGLFKDEDEDI